MTDLDAAKSTLVAELREHSLVICEVTLASGAVAQYYVDARRTLMRPGGFRAAGELIAAAAHEFGASAVGGPATAAIPPARAPVAVEGGEDLVAFFVRGEKKQHGLQRWVEGPVEAGVKALIVEDTVTTGGSTAKAIEPCREGGLGGVGGRGGADRPGRRGREERTRRRGPLPRPGNDRRALSRAPRPGLRPERCPPSPMPSRS